MIETWSIDLGGNLFLKEKFIFELNLNSRIGVALTGGLDSAVILFLAAKLNKLSGNSSILIPFWVAIKDDDEYQFAVRTTKFVNEKLGLNISEPYIEGKDLLHLNPRAVRLRAVKPVIIKKYNLNLIITGETKNPPIEIIKKEIERPEHNRNPRYDSEIYAPFINFDKRYVIDLYRKLDILDLIKYTRSCDNLGPWNLPICGTCPHCLERQWGFLENNLVDIAPNPISYEDLYRL